ncbi:hypothetical protein AB0J83_17730 [Actinoplanes sp. NPDC049596]|uniref:hypothetical protein n=1 Tax=unclassified Actinoplanes TaxID=2626549 RepID=UPI003448A475
MTDRSSVLACGRCGGPGYAFDPGRAPQGSEETEAAVECLLQHVPVLRPLDRGVLGAIVDDHFRAGWCVRDVVHALDQRPDNEGHEIWSAKEPPERLLWHVHERLRTWRWTDGGEIMAGPWTARRAAMATAHRLQADRQRERDESWHEQIAGARAATGAGRAEARRVAAEAGAAARRNRAHAAEADAMHRRAQVRAARQQALTDGG